MNLPSQGMNMVKRKMTEEKCHKDANCFLMVIIRFGLNHSEYLSKNIAMCYQQSWNSR